jgi:hypothetical protein
VIGQVLDNGYGLKRNWGFRLLYRSFGSDLRERQKY